MTRHTKLYDLLGVERTASHRDIVKAYRVRALVLHPDKRRDVDEDCANREFQALQKAYEILQDPERRQHYDAFGEEEDEALSSYLARWTAPVHRVTPEDIREFEKTYKGSPEEEEDLIAFYQRVKGNIRQLLEYIPLSQPEDVERFVAMYHQLIDQGRVKKTQAFDGACAALRRTGQKKYASRVKRESKHVQPSQDATGSSTSLILALQANKQKRQESKFLEQLEAKYAAPSKRRKKKL